MVAAEGAGLAHSIKQCNGTLSDHFPALLGRVASARASGCLHEALGGGCDGAPQGHGADSGRGKGAAWGRRAAGRLSRLGVLRRSRLRRLDEMTSATNLVHSAHTSRSVQPCAYRWGNSSSTDRRVRLRSDLGGRGGRVRNDLGTFCGLCGTLQLGDCVRVMAGLSSRPLARFRLIGLALGEAAYLSHIEQSMWHRLNQPSLPFSTM